MKKSISLLLAIVCLIANLNAQNFVSNVPSSATVVIKYAGENFSNLTPVKKLDSYSFIKSNLFKMLDMDTLTSIQNMGIDFEQDSYQYVVSEDSALSFVTLVHIKNAAQFLQLFKAAEKAKDKTEEKNGFKLLSLSGNTYIGWNDSKAIIVNTTFQFKESYLDHKYKYDTLTTTVKVEDATIEEIAVDSVKVIPPPKVLKDGYKVPKKGTKPVAGGKKKPAVKAKTPVKKKPTIETEEEVIAYQKSIEDSIEDRKRELWEQQQDMIANKKQHNVAENIFVKSFTNSINSIDKKLDYQKIVNPNAHVSLWINSDLLLTQYQSYFSGSMYRYMRYANQSYNADTTAGFKSALNLYFEKDNIKMEQKSFSENEALETLGKNVMNSKQSNGLLNFVNPDNIGYASMSINTEAMMNYYYTMLKKYFASDKYMSEYSDAANVYIDLLQILIDEKGIADLAPGNYMFVLHNMDTKMVDYIDYTYDSEYKSKEVKKSKKELAPNFTFAMETRREDFLQKLAKLPIKYAKKGDYDYKDKGGYFVLAFDSSKYPINNLYFMIKDGKGIITTSKTVIDNTLAGKGFTADASTTNNVLNNNYASKIDLKRVFDILNTKASTKSGKAMTAYMRDNVSEVNTASSYKDGMIQGVTNVKITGNHTNSLEFIFNMIETLNKIDSDDKIEQSKKQD
jgi:Domain of unknown function (DUF4836)